MITLLVLPLNNSVAETFFGSQLRNALNKDNTSVNDRRRPMALPHHSSDFTIHYLASRSLLDTEGVVDLKQKHKMEEPLPGFLFDF